MSIQTLLTFLRTLEVGDYQITYEDNSTQDYLRASQDIKVRPQ